MYELNIERDYTFISKLYEKIGNYKLMRINIIRQMQKGNNSSLAFLSSELVALSISINPNSLSSSCITVKNLFNGIFLVKILG